MKKTLLILFTVISFPLFSQGTWTALANPNYSGIMFLLSDGTVMAKGWSSSDTTVYGVSWSKLTPDIHGSYINGTWSPLAPMNNSRLYFASQVLMDGRVFVAGGEYGTGDSLAETYDPVSDSWTMAPPLNYPLWDANSEILPDGRVLVSQFGLQSSLIFDPMSNSWSQGSATIGNADESSWVKLPDNSILYVDIASTNSERYIPSLNQWIADAVVPDSLYDNNDSETGAGFLLPDGRVFFLGGMGHTAYYTPSGNTNPGTWTAGPDIPSGLGVPDAGAAMMVNGKILCAVSPVPAFWGDFPSPTSFYEFDYLNNSFTPINIPNGSDTLTGSSYGIIMLDLPDGTVLVNIDGGYIYSPGGTPLAAGKPTVSSITQNACTYTITGTLFNGISEGAAYGDDWQMASNYPLVRLSSGSNVYYARTFNWNRTGVQTGTLPDTVQFTVPAGVPPGTYYLAVAANGNASNPFSFNYNPCIINGIQETGNLNNTMAVYPNPSNGHFFMTLSSAERTITVCNILGEKVYQSEIHNLQSEIDLSSYPAGIYFLQLKTQQGIISKKLIIKQ